MSDDSTGVSTGTQRIDGRTGEATAQCGHEPWRITASPSRLVRDEQAARAAASQRRKVSMMILRPPQHGQGSRGSAGSTGSADSSTNVSRAAHGRVRHWPCGRRRRAGHKCRTRWKPFGRTCSRRRRMSSSVASADEAQQFRQHRIEQEEHAMPPALHYLELTELSRRIHAREIRRWRPRQRS